ncbi:DUF5798 family protein [Haloarchaeobius sp. HRN-SO-5]|uniref:DUF5798 family protein n=1 Tax=Haloarchaeobius sp. HRN-SO-5 TaxID=3446118 RepID=UPI003EBF621D
MGLGSTAKTIQTLADRAEQLYAQLMDVRERLSRIEDDIEATSDRVIDVERELEEQRVVLEALAEDAGLDPDRLIAESTIVDAEDAADSAADAGETHDASETDVEDVDSTTDADEEDDTPAATNE